MSDDIARNIKTYLDLYQKAPYDLARNQYTVFSEPFDPDLIALVRRIFPDPVIPSIKYGEHKWGAFA